MKCFIHINDEAIAVCKKCGKAMCGNCSAYTNHSGICPECVREDYIKERNTLYARLSSIKGSIIRSVIFAVLFAVVAVVLAVTVHAFGLVVLIGTLIFAIKLILRINDRKPVVSRIDFLTAEINKLGAALNRSAAII